MLISLNFIADSSIDNGGNHVSCDLRKGKNRLRNTTKKF